MLIFWMFSIEKWSVYKNCFYAIFVCQCLLLIAVKLGAGKKI